MKRLFAVFILVVSYSALADKWNAHDATPMANQQYRLGNGDPYLEYELDEPVGGNGGVVFSLHVEGHDAPFIMEVFYSTNLHGYDPFYEFRFKLDPLDQQRIYLPIALTGSEKLDHLRFDFEQCLNCVVRISDVEVRRQDDKSLHEFIPDYEPLPVLGSLELDGRTLNIDEWEEGDIEIRDHGELLITGKNPHIRSNPVNIPSQKLAGIAFELGAPEKEEFYTLKLFYETYDRGFSARAGIHMRVYSGRDTLKIMVPLETVPEKSIVKRLQLGFEPCNRCSWQFVSARLIHTDNVGDVSNHVPKQIVVLSSKRAAWSALLGKIFLRLNQDLWFFGFYTLLLLVVVAYSFNRYRRLD